MFMRILALLVLTAGLVACATPDAVRSVATSASTGPEPEVSAKHTAGSKQFSDAATTPLSDLNLLREAIPAVLIAAQKGPYLAPLKAGCDVLAANVLALDEVLEPDLDVPVLPSDAGLAERGADAVGQAAVGALRSAAEGVIPFRGWIRKLSGAERYAREVAAAIAAGTVRRAFLKGLGQAQGCQAPAAPRRARSDAS